MTGKAVGRNRWRSLVTTEPMLNTGTRLLLLVLTDRMQSDGRVKVPRREVAATVGTSERQVDRRLTEAVTRDWLERIAPGHNGRHAVYQATVPRVSSATGSATPSATGTDRSSATPTNAQPVALRSVRPDPSSATSGVALNRQGERSERVAVDRSAAAEPAPLESSSEEDNDVDPDGHRARALKSWGLSA